MKQWKGQKRNESAKGKKAIWIVKQLETSRSVDSPLFSHPRTHNQKIILQENHHCSHLHGLHARIHPLSFRSLFPTRKFQVLFAQILPQPFFCVLCSCFIHKSSQECFNVQCGMRRKRITNCRCYESSSAGSRASHAMNESNKCRRYENNKSCEILI